MKQIENIHQFREEKKHNPFSYQRLFGTIHPDAVPEDFKRELNTERKWKYGYNEQFDIVVISRDGTLGDVYELEGVKIGLPAEPEDKTKILNYDKPKEEQYWKPEVIPKELLDVESEAVAWNARPENRNNILTPTEIFYRKPQKFIDKYLSYINSDFDKREQGVWIYVNGKAYWLPPSHYFFIQHIPVKGSILPDFRFTNRDYYLFWEATKADNRCLGMIYLKNRRSGASSMAGSEMLNFATEVYEGFLGVMSKTNKDSISFLNRMVIRTFKKLPWYFKPQTSGTTSASSGLLFSEIAKKMSKKHTTMTANEGLDTSIKQFSTSLNSMDGEAVDMMVLDECGKYPTEVPFDEYWAVAEECLTQGFKITGTVMAISTVNSQSKGGRGFKEIYYASDVRKRMENGRTATGMYRLFIPAEWNQAGGYDKFGYSILEVGAYAIINRDGDLVRQGNIERLEEKAKALKKKSAALYNEFLRKHPRTENHAFRDESSDSDFNLNLIYEQMDYNEMLEVEPYERGNFIDVNEGVPDTDPEIQWRPNKYSGRFYVSWMPPKDLRNNFAVRGREYHPLNDFGCFGVDPYKVSQTVDGRGSKGGGHLLTGTSMNVEKIPSDEFVVEYVEKPATVEQFMRDMRNVFLFYGVPALIESNVDKLLVYLLDNNMTRFCLRRADKVKLTLDEKRLGGISMTSEKVRQDHYFAIQSYIEKRVGEAVDDEYRDEGDMGRMPFNRTLNSWSKFSPDNRTTEDASISSGLAIMGVQMMKLGRRYRKSINPLPLKQKAPSLMKKYKY